MLCLRKWVDVPNLGYICLFQNRNLTIVVFLAGLNSPRRLRSCVCLYLEEEATELASGSYKPVRKGGQCWVAGGGGGCWASCRQVWSEYEGRIMGIGEVGGRRNSCEEDEEGGRQSRDVDYVDYGKEQQRQGSQVEEYKYGAALGGGGVRRGSVWK